LTSIAEPLGQKSTSQNNGACREWFLSDNPFSPEALKLQATQKFVAYYFGHEAANLMKKCS
jgi:hypothetical protein